MGLFTTTRMSERPILGFAAQVALTENLALMVADKGLYLTAQMVGLVWPILAVAVELVLGLHLLEIDQAALAAQALPASGGPSKKSTQSRRKSCQKHKQT